MYIGTYIQYNNKSWKSFPTLDEPCVHNVKARRSTNMHRYRLTMVCPFSLASVGKGKCVFS